MGFEHEGYAVLIARDGVDRLRRASTEEYDVIILDVMLPNMAANNYFPHIFTQSCARALPH